MTTFVIICKVFGGSLDTVVVGAGPAGLAAALHCAALGLRVACVAPGTRQPWPANYAAWEHELQGVAARCVQASWSRAQVYWDDEPHTLPLRYARLDQRRLQRELLDRCLALGVRLLDRRVTAITHQPECSTIDTDAGPLSARLVIDASGAGSPFVRRVDSRPPAFQSAYGVLAEVESHPYPPDTMVFMDLRDVEPGAPSFLYAMPLSPTLLFVEETSLAARPKLPLKLLHARLIKRLARLDIRVRNVRERERCLIPMGIAPPAAHQSLIAFGAAGAMVHPATGYQLSRMLNMAPLLAGAIVNGLDQGGPSEAVAYTDELLWPSGQRRCWELYTFGMEALCRFNGDQLRAFMRAFFQLPPHLWQGYLAAELPFPTLSKAMWNVFSSADSTLRWRLVRLSTGGGARRLWSAFSIPNQI